MNGKIIRLTLSAGALILATSGAAMAQEGAAVKNLLGSIGIIPKDPPKINYRERAPLVLPPQTTLRPPVDSVAVGEQTPNWPKDPDVLAARKEASESAKPEILRERFKLDKGDRLSIEEVRAGRQPGAGSRGQQYTNDRRDDRSRLTPEELRAPNETEAKLDPNGIERRYLSDPPQTLLRAAGNAPLKASQDRKSLADPDSPYAFQREQNGEAPQ